MTEFEKAISVINSIVITTGTETVALTNSLNRVLAENILSDTDMPPFTKAAMDGYACRKADLGMELTVVEEIPAGKVPLHTIGKGQCARIMTGAMLPEGADFVLMKEHVEITGSGTLRREKLSDNANICQKGEDLRKGDPVLLKGIRIAPAHAAVLAATGCLEPRVYQLPRIAILSTGNELTNPAEKPEKGKIRNTNGYQIYAQALHYGISAFNLGIVPDDKESLKETIAGIIDQYDLLIITGGVSVGDYDYVPEILGSLGIEELFRGLRIKPGKHMILGRKDNHFIAAMPGNPVSAFVLFEVVIKPLLNRITGSDDNIRRLILPYERDFSRSNDDILLFLPVQITGNGTVVPVEYHGSAHIHAYTQADGIMEIPVGVSEIRKGEKVHVRPV